MDSTGTSEFDSYSGSYESDLQKGLDLSGENASYFAESRAAWTAKCLGELGRSVNKILDFGCGTGGSVAHLLKAFANSTLVGTDPSQESLSIARRDHDPGIATFVPPEELTIQGCDLAFCNGVFHHIVPGERPAALRTIWDSLGDSGYFAFWENNPWNPGTRIVMSRIPFDKDAITISPSEALRLLRENGFSVVRRDFLFWFPRPLAAFRGVEPWLTKVPLGAQYSVLCRKIPA